MTKPWPGGYAILGSGDYGTAYQERTEIYNLVRDAGITGFAIVSGDRHSFWAGYAAKALPPAAPFEPVGVSFVGGSMTSVGSAEANEYVQKKVDNPTRGLYIAEDAHGKPQCTQNLTLRHGVRSALEYEKTKDLQKALAVRNPELAPHLTFVDNGATATPPCAATPTTWSPSSSASRVRSRAARAMTAGHCVTASAMKCRCGRRARSRRCVWLSWRAMWACRSDKNQKGVRFICIDK